MANESKEPEELTLYDGGNRQYNEITGRMDNDHSEYISRCEWLCGRSATGIVEPYYIGTTIQTTGTTNVRDAVLALTFNDFPATLKGGSKEFYFQTNIALVMMGPNNTPDTTVYNVEVWFDDSEKHAVATLSSGESKTLVFSVAEMVDSLPCEVNRLNIALRDVPSTHQGDMNLNKMVLTYVPNPQDPKSFDPTVWYDEVNGIENPSDHKWKPDEELSNHVSRPQEELVHYDNGNHSISPVGFPYVNKSGVSNTGVCSGDEENNPVFAIASFDVDNKVSGGEYKDGYDKSNIEDILSNISFNSPVNIKKLYGPTIELPVYSLDAVDDLSIYKITVSGNVSGIQYRRLTIIATGSDKLVGTEFFSDDIEHTRGDVLFSEVTAEYDMNTGLTTFTMPNTQGGCMIEHLDDGILSLSFGFDDNDFPIYVALNGQNKSTENGIYVIKYVADDPYSDNRYWMFVGIDPRKSTLVTDLTDKDDYVFADPTVNDNVWACCNGTPRPHFRKGYSDREVLDFVESKIGVYSNFGMHSPSIGNDKCNGAFVSWFTQSGAVDLTQQNGKPVVVNGFGLGAAYDSLAVATDSIKADKQRSDVENETSSLNTIHPWLFWGYGSKWDVKDEATNVTPLPLDWPFCNYSKYAKYYTNNNITLLKEAGAIPNTDVAVGNLEFDEEDEETEEVTNHVDINRHHVVIYNDLTKVDSTGKRMPTGYKAGTTVVKPTFIHLPAPLSVKDGDTFDVTVSLQNLNADELATGSDVKDLSAYYSIVSQPRVYIVGGFQQFASERYKIDDPTHSMVSTDEFRVHSDKQICDDNDEPLPVGTEIRANLVSTTMSPYETTFVGIIVNSSSSQGTTVKFNGRFPYEVGGRKWKANTLALCGIAYMGGAEENNPTEVKMGLVTRTPEILGADYGEGADGSVGEFNKFFSLNKDIDGRYTFPGKDKRYVLATVYQGSTNTFPWALNGRRKLSHLNVMMTDEADTDYDSLSSGAEATITRQAWELNKEILDLYDADHKDRDAKKVDFDYAKGGYAFTPTVMPLTYNGTHTQSQGESFIASHLRVKLGERYDSLDQSPEGNPVRQAIRAYADLIDDFTKLRCGYRNFSDITPADPGLDIGMESRDSLPSADSFWRDTDSLVYLDDANDVTSSHWETRFRNIPEYIRNADWGDSEIAGIDNDWYAFDVEHFDDYASYSDYCYDMGSVYDSSRSTAEVNCDLSGAPNRPHQFGYRSVIRAIIESKPNVMTKSPKLMNDLFRMAESQVGYVKPYLRNLNHKYTAAGGDLTPNDELWSPFTKIFSTDGLPSPIAKESDVASLTEGQQAFISGDAVHKYWYGLDDEQDIDYVSDVMPTSGSLARFLENYVAPHAAKLPMRMYKGTRIFFGDSVDETDPSYLTSVTWYSRMFGDCDGTTINRYVNDTFAYADGDTCDYNMNWNELIPAGETERYLELNLSAAPYTADNSFNTRFGNKSTYTRVFMQFTFSAKAGRWYTTDYRQIPTTYLTPLYGAATFNDRIDSVSNEIGEPAHVSSTGDSSASLTIWQNSMCGVSDTYRQALYMPYRAYLPMDITLGCVPFLFNEFPYNMDASSGSYGQLKDEFRNDCDKMSNAYMRRLVKAYKPAKQSADVLPEDRGLSLYPPADVNGGYHMDTDNGPHANFWSVRKYLRPAVGALPGTDVPSPEDYTDGLFSDPTLYAMFDEPNSIAPIYHMPDPEYPLSDLTRKQLIWYEDSLTGPIMANQEDNTWPYLSYAVENDFDRMDDESYHLLYDDLAIMLADDGEILEYDREEEEG